MLGSHPREQFEAHFDIVTPSPRRSDHNEWVLVQHSLLVALCICVGVLKVPPMLCLSYSIVFKSGCAILVSHGVVFASQK